MSDLQKILDEKIPASAVSIREGIRGTKLSYLTGHYVINRLNHVFGSLGWASDIKLQEKLYEGKIQNSRGQESYYVSYRAMVRLVVSKDGVTTEHTDIGFGDGQDATNPGKAHELALKESITDALKRCAKNLGMSMGLALYDKDQPNVEEADLGKQVAQKAPESIRSVPGVKAAAPAPAAQPDLGQVLRSITATSKVLVSKGLDTVDGLRAKMKDKYGVEDKAQLDYAKANELLTSLKGQLNEQQQ